MERNQHSELRRAIEETRRRYGFPDIEKRYPATMLDTFFLKDAIALEEQLQSVEAERTYFSEQTDAMFAQKVDAEAERNRLKEQVETLRELNDRIIAERDSWERECNGLSEQLEAVTRVAEAAKTYRDVRGDYSWVQMIQALDAWEHPNPAISQEGNDAA